MPIQTPILNNFTAGELTPLLNGRVDFAKYANGCSQLENFKVFPQGGITRRGGTQYINEVKDHSKATRLISFEFNVEQTYILEFGHNYIRFFKDLGRIESGTPIEVTTTYTETEIFDIQFVQSADTLYLVHKNHAPAKLTRSSHTSWTLSNITFTATPTEWVASNYPQTVAFFEQRLYFAGTPNEPQTLWASKSGDYENFTQGSLDDDSLEYTIATDQVNVIRWLSPGKRLIVGTAGGEFVVSASSQEEAVTPSNVRIVRQSTYGSAFTKPIRIADVVLYLQRAKRKLRQFVYNFESDSFVSPDVTLLSEHITQGGVKEMDLQQEPFQTIWCVLDNGGLISMSYLRDQEVIAWSKHFIGGTDVTVESVAIIPPPSGCFCDEIWLTVKRTINGATKRYVEVIRPGLRETETVADAFFLDSALSYDSTPVSSVSGLSHLEGETVSVLADGTTHPSVIVSSGSINLNDSYSKVHVGLPYTSKMTTMRIEAGAAPNSTAQGATKRISNIVLRLHRSLGIKVGSSETKHDLIPFRSSADSMDSSVGLFTGDKEVSLRSGYDTDGKVFVMQDQPLPLTILALVPRVKTNGK